jgi:hypothetical protein
LYSHLKIKVVHSLKREVGIKIALDSEGASYRFLYRHKSIGLNKLQVDELWPFISLLETKATKMEEVLFCLTLLYAYVSIRRYNSEDQHTQRVDSYTHASLQE